MLCRCFLSKGETDICHRCICDASAYPFGRLIPDKQGKNNIHFLDSFTAVWYYEGDVRKSILRYKFRRGIFLAPKFARMLAERLTQQEMAHPDVLTWVPVSRARGAMTNVSFLPSSWEKRWAFLRYLPSER